MPRPPYNPDPPCCFIVGGFRPIFCNRSRKPGTDYCEYHQPLRLGQGSEQNKG